MFPRWKVIFVKSLLLPLALYLHTLALAALSIEWLSMLKGWLHTDPKWIQVWLVFWPKRSESALTAKLLIHDYTLTKTKIRQIIFNAFSIRTNFLMFLSLSLFLFFSSVYIVVIHKCRRLFNGHTRRRRSHIEMPFQWTTHCQWVLLLLGPCVWYEIWKCGHRTNPVEYKLQVRIVFFLLNYYILSGCAVSGSIEVDWTPIGTEGAAGKLFISRRA